MKRWFSSCAILWVAGGLVGICPGPAVAASAIYKPAPFSNYQPILDRMPFGPLPANFNQNAAVDAAQAKTDAQVQAEQQKLAKQVNMSAVTVTPEGKTAVGFTDLSVKPPANYYLLVGGSADGWTVQSADYDEEWAKIEKEGVTITLKLGQGLVNNPPAATGPASRPPQPGSLLGKPDNKGLPPGLVRHSSSKPGPPPSASARLSAIEKQRKGLAEIQKSGGSAASYLERLRERKAQEKAAHAAAEKANREKLQELARKITQDELAKRERELNLQLLQQQQAAQTTEGAEETQQVLTDQQLEAVQ